MEVFFAGGLNVGGGCAVDNVEIERQCQEHWQHVHGDGYDLSDEQVNEGVVCVCGDGLLVGETGE